MLRRIAMVVCISIFSFGLDATRVIFLPQVHEAPKTLGNFQTSEEVNEEIYQSQLQIYNFLKDLFSSTGTENVAVFDETMHYHIVDGKIKRALPPQQGDKTDKDYLIEVGASKKIVAEGIRTPFKPTVLVSDDSPYSIAERALQLLMDECAKVEAYRNKEHADPAILKALDDQLLENFYTEVLPLIELPREHEVVSRIAESIQENPDKVHVLIFGSEHLFSRFFRNISGIEFEIPHGFAETLGIHASNHDFDEYIALHKNPLRDIVILPKPR